MVSKQRKAFYRKLFIAFLISTERHNVPSLMAATGMPRRTLQDAIASMDDFDIDCQFVQDGSRNNDGYFVIRDWGAINVAWLAQHIEQIEQSLTTE